MTPPPEPASGSTDPTAPDRSGTSRTVSAALAGDVTGGARVELLVAVARRAGLDVDEALSVLVDGEPVEPSVVEVGGGARVHLLEGVEGALQVDYRATVTGVEEPAAVTEQDLVTFARPSRYAESDRLFAFARRQFGEGRPVAERVTDVASWVGSRLAYVPGSSGPTDGAVDTLLTGQGVCRDYAHLVTALLRGLDVPARLVAVYAPGCDPMDFHAVVEAVVDGTWQCVDATCLAPRQSLVRISDGRDAADTAFLTTIGGGLVLTSSLVTAVVDGDLPVDDSVGLVPLGRGVARPV